MAKSPGEYMEILMAGVTVTDAGCWEWTRAQVDLGSYGRIAIFGQSMLAHRAMWMLRYGGIPVGLRVLHRCDNRPCIRPAHLFLGTQSDNIRDCVNKGRHIAGRRRLTPDQVRQIRRTHAAGEGTIRQLGAAFDVSHVQISRVINRRTWRHVA